MRRIESPYKKLLLVCTNRRDDGRECCGAGGSDAVRDALKARLKGLGLPVRVSKTGCMGMCATGPTVVLMPDGLWLGEVSLDDVDALVELVHRSFDAAVSQK
jgi:(2Fe-2S) ferredoxin